mmetsp:Transcript_1284/g.2715  ORF Transcript_1284/g.2715 Transcript_1284/m.2715 type:complete len:202 (-) Transcript_1284:384-989(-)
MAARRNLAGSGVTPSGVAKRDSSVSSHQQRSIWRISLSESPMQPRARSKQASARSVCDSVDQSVRARAASSSTSICKCLRRAAGRVPGRANWMPIRRHAAFSTGLGMPSTGFFATCTELPSVGRVNSSTTRTPCNGWRERSKPSAICTRSEPRMPRLPFLTDSSSRSQSSCMTALVRMRWSCRHLLSRPSSPSNVDGSIFG